MDQGTFTIFFSWQSSHPKENKHLINKYLGNVEKDKSLHGLIKIKIDEGTKNTFGSPHIATVIFDKIDKCDIFVCDVSIINNDCDLDDLSKRLTPNPNVLIELGYAVKSLGWERVICIANTKFGKVENLPFDIKSNRISTYNSSEVGFEEKLRNTLNQAISKIINNYDGILKRFCANDNKTHDRNISSAFLNICSQDELFDSISETVNQMRTTNEKIFLWNRYESFYTQISNKFLDAELDSNAESLILNINNFHLKCGGIFFPYSEQNDSSESLKKIFDSSNHIYSFPKDPNKNETWGDFGDRQHNRQIELSKLGKKVELAYRDIIMAMKRKNLI